MKSTTAGPPLKARVGSSQHSETSFKRKRGMFQKELQHMMYGFGDDQNRRKGRRMQRSEKSSMLARMAELRLVCEGEGAFQQKTLDSLDASYENHFSSVKSMAQDTIKLQDELRRLKDELKEAENERVKALGEKSRKEATRIATMESISLMKARVNELRGTVENQRAMKHEFAAIISQSEACKEKCIQNSEQMGQIEEVISWYNRVLGFRIETGDGVKFIFTNISPERPNKEYSFVIRVENKIYTLFGCDPPLSNTKELVGELNKSNGLFKFVRIMREKFQEAAAHGPSVHGSSLDQQTSIVSLSAPVASGSTNCKYETPVKRKGLESAESNSISRKVDKDHLIQSPGSASSLRRSRRLKEPLPEAVALVEDIVVEYVTDMVHKAQDIGSKRLTEDILFLLRKDFPKLNRCTELLSMNEELKQARKAFEVDEEKLALAD